MALLSFLKFHCFTSSKNIQRKTEKVYIIKFKPQKQIFTIINYNERKSKP